MLLHASDLYPLGHEHFDFCYDPTDPKHLATILPFLLSSSGRGFRAQGDLTLRLEGFDCLSLGGSYPAFTEAVGYLTRKKQRTLILVFDESQYQEVVTRDLMDVVNVSKPYYPEPSDLPDLYDHFLILVTGELLANRSLRAYYHRMLEGIRSTSRIMILTDGEDLPAHSTFRFVRSARGVV